MIGKYIFATLSADSAITALVQASGGDIRIYPVIAPQNTIKPYITYRVTSITPKDACKEAAATDDAYMVDFHFFESPDKPNEAQENIEALHEAVRLNFDHVANTAAGVTIKYAEFSGSSGDGIEATTFLFFRTSSYLFRVVR